MRHTTLALAALALVAGAVCACAGDMTLTKDGSLYRLSSDGEQLVLTLTATDGTVTTTALPETTGIAATNLEVAVDEATETVVTLWQENEGEQALIALATLTAGTWQGPLVLAGGDGLSAVNPALLVDRVVTTAEEESGPVTYADTIIHVAWWQGLETATGGVAQYAAIPLEDDGTLVLDAAVRLTLSDLIPFGVACGDIPDPARLARPRLFIDPKTGDPHLMAVDLTTCLFQIVQLDSELGEPDPITKRRRNTIIFGYTEMIATNPSLPLQTAKVEVGRDLSVVLYWDEDTAISYVNLTADGWSALKSLPFGATLSHDRAVELIRGLAR